jgi:hypothetical protein
MKAEGFPVAAACKASEISTSAYYEWKERGPSDSEVVEAYLINEIFDIWAESDRFYGSPNITKELRRRGYASTTSGSGA